MLIALAREIELLPDRQDFAGRTFTPQLHEIDLSRLQDVCSNRNTGSSSAPEWLIIELVSRQAMIDLPGVAGLM